MNFILYLMNFTLSLKILQSDFAKDLLNQINLLRSYYNIKPLKINDLLMKVSENHSKYQNSKREMTLTTRQRALQSSKDASASGANLIEFPNGLPPAPPRSENLSRIYYFSYISLWL